MAKKLHKSQRWVQLQIQMGNDLSEESKQQIRENPKLIYLARHHTGLLQLSKFDEEGQKLILNQIICGKARKIREAIAQLRGHLDVYCIFCKKPKQNHNDGLDFKCKWMCFSCINEFIDEINSLKK